MAHLQIRLLENFGERWRSLMTFRQESRHRWCYYLWEGLKGWRCRAWGQWGWGSDDLGGLRSKLTKGLLESTFDHVFQDVEVVIHIIHLHWLWALKYLEEVFLTQLTFNIASTKVKSGLTHYFHAVDLLDFFCQLLLHFVALSLLHLHLIMDKKSIVPRGLSQELSTSLLKLLIRWRHN